MLLPCLSCNVPLEVERGEFPLLPANSTFSDLKEALALISVYHEGGSDDFITSCFEEGNRSDILRLLNYGLGLETDRPQLTTANPFHFGVGVPLPTTPGRAIARPLRCTCNFCSGERRRPNDE